MKGGVTYLDMEKRKDAEFALKRLEMWLHKEAIVHDFISDAAISTIRIVLAGCLPATDSNPHRIDGLAGDVPPERAPCDQPMTVEFPELNGGAL